MIGMAQEIQQIGVASGLAAKTSGRMGSLSWSGPEAKSGDGLGESTHMLDMSSALLTALGDESSRRILMSAIEGGKTVDEISAEQGLPLSTCYRKVRYLLDEGLMLLERMVVTQTGKRYAVYRATISEAKISFNRGEVDVQVTPNPEILEKLRRRWLSAAYPLQNQDDRLSITPASCHRLVGRSSGPFE